MNTLSPDAFRSRTPQTDVDLLAMMPVTLRAPTPDEAGRGVVIAYWESNFTVYRGVIDRLVPGERFRMERRGEAYEMSAQEFAAAFHRIAATPSFRTGTASMAHGCYYTISRESPPEADQFRVGPVTH